MTLRETEFEMYSFIFLFSPSIFLHFVLPFLSDSFSQTVSLYRPFSSILSVIFRSLVPVTQLYVSVDASTKDSLKKIDRPLFKDYWPRFLDSLRALGEKVSCPLS